MFWNSRSDTPLQVGAANACVLLIHSTRFDIQANRVMGSVMEQIKLISLGTTVQENVLLLKCFWPDSRKWNEKYPSAQSKAYITPTTSSWLRLQHGQRLVIKVASSHFTLFLQQKEACQGLWRRHRISLPQVCFTPLHSLYYFLQHFCNTYSMRCSQEWVWICHHLYSFSFIYILFKADAGLGTHSPFSACFPVLQLVVEVHSCDVSVVEIVGFMWVSDDWHWV